MAGPERFELPTYSFVARRSIQLSYGPTEVSIRNDSVSRKYGPSLDCSCNKNAVKLATNTRVEVKLSFLAQEVQQNGVYLLC
jgi:hypothetical protein